MSDAESAEWIALSEFEVPDLPTLTLLGDQERVVDPTAVTQRIHSNENGELLLCKGAKHEVLMETPEVQAKVWKALDNLWLTSDETNG